MVLVDLLDKVVEDRESPLGAAQGVNVDGIAPDDGDRLRLIAERAHPPEPLPGPRGVAGELVRAGDEQLQRTLRGAIDGRCCITADEVVARRLPDQLAVGSPIGGDEGALHLIRQDDDVPVDQDWRGRHPVLARKWPERYAPALPAAGSAGEQPKLREKCIDVLTVRHRSWRGGIVQAVALLAPRSPHRVTPDLGPGRAVEAENQAQVALVARQVDPARR